MYLHIQVDNLKLNSIRQKIDFDTLQNGYEQHVLASNYGMKSQLIHVFMHSPLIIRNLDSFDSHNPNHWEEHHSPLYNIPCGCWWGLHKSGKIPQVFQMGIPKLPNCEFPYFKLISHT